MQNLLTKKVAVITGCNRGIGKSILIKFAEQGAEIFACSRKEDKKFSGFCLELSKKSKTKIHNVFFDLNKAEEMRVALSKIKEISENVDVLVNNAGTIQTSLFQMTKIEDMRKIFEINFFATFLFSQYIVKLMIKNKSQSSIINISSSAAIEANQGRSAYASSKSALTTLSKVMSKELSNFNIRVNAIAPSITKTDMFDQMDEKARNKLIESSALKRPAEAVEVSNVALFLASNLSSFITGQVLRVDGGLTT